MKRILRDTCILAALMILCVFTVSIIWVGLTDEIRLVIELFLLSFIITLANWFIDEFISLSILWCYVVKYVVATGIVMLFGFIAGWFFRSNFWMAFIYVGIVLVLAYLVDVIKTKKDIEFINSKIKGR
ncbi:hypothetical protein SAMN02745229_02358 [Butyrivibrio fibrisolvens DSM 3071]|uniref:DUF3021 domain-containing protein n=1 Tax=Butyrivibrio fibrisolvens DSM 3071 TaxID=1121131 RepID=A0A1M5ZK40_BUTFI|nr:hypothetical protein [Butyrivibrio fibrisolvens]SHI24532.1 hypothetical protein SAMN02745229_02358 [Butyrivibrio fibrisolvens DSM 3071]